jgi:undecaprenyl diphosphate synthase
LITTNCRPTALSQPGLLRTKLKPLRVNTTAAPPQSTLAAEPTERPRAPHHLAIAPGGHRLWAADRLMPEAAALLQGLDGLMDTVEFCSAHGVQRLTFLALPSDHALGPCEGSGGYWLPALMRAVWVALNKLPRLGVRLRLVGEWPALDPALMAALLEAQARTCTNAGMWLNLQPIQPLTLWGAEGTQQPHTQAFVALQSVAEEAPIGSPGGAEPDLVIRTGGSTLAKDGMVWDTTRSALYFTNRAWPDFNGLDLRRALHWYGSEGRAGGMQVGLAPRGLRQAEADHEPAQIGRPASRPPNNTRTPPCHATKHP